jgi:hypothetical protein
MTQAATVVTKLKLWSTCSMAVSITLYLSGLNSEIIFNAMHPTLAHHITDAHTKSVLTLTIQEIKRNILYKRMNLQQNEDDQPVPIIRIQAHLLNVLKKTLSFLIYQGTSKTNSSQIFLNVLIQKLTDRIA